MILGKKTIYGTLAAVIPFLAILPMEFSGRLRGLENTLVDLRHKYFNAGHAHAPDVVIVDIDERTLNAYKSEKLFGRWPWRRDVYGPIMRYIADGGPKIILVDILFTEASPEDKQLEDDTAELAAAIPISHSLQFRIEEDPGIEKVPDFVLAKGYPIEYQNFKPRPYNTMQYPAGGIARNNSLLHSVRYWSDPDSISRMAEPVFQYGASSYLFLPLQGYLSLYEPGAHVSIAPDQMTIAGRRNGKEEAVHVPLEAGRMRINYYEEWVYDATAKDSLHRISMSGVIDSIRALEVGGVDQGVKVPREAFQDKIVILATSASATFDDKRTPHGTMPGYVIHATLLSNLIARHFLSSGSPLWGFTAAFILLACAAFFVLRFHSMIVRVAVPAALFFVCTGAVIVAFQYDFAFYFAPIPVTFLPGYLGMLGVLTYFEGAEKRRFRGAMAKYLSPDVLEEVMKRGELKAEVGERRILTVLFSDVRGFTTISENMDAGKVVEILNEYFSHMVKIIFDNRGTLDKFIGDAIMAFWGAPIERADHASLAVQSALAMTASLRALNADFIERGIMPLSIGIGVHTGEMIVGNIGSDQRLDYTLIGDNVNLGSRVESLTKQYGVEILITQATKDHLHGSVPCRVIDVVAVKGKSIPVPVYEPLDHPFGDMPPEAVSLAFDNAFENYRRRDWDQAMELYRALDRARPDGDTTCRLMIERCQSYKSDPPGPEWDGAHVMKTK